MTGSALLVLEDGTHWRGNHFGSEGKCFGELVFATGMTGYQETITDPSYAGQIVIQTAPHIGNTGMNARDEESARIWVEGYVVREPSRMVSNFRSEWSLGDDLENSGVVGISKVDTRAITRYLRDKGVMRAGIFAGAECERPFETLLQEVKASSPMKGRSLSDVVSTLDRYTVAHTGPFEGRVVVLDLGIKRSTLEHLAARGLELVVLPADSSLEQILELHPDAVFYSNGPGDPEAASTQIAVLQEVLKRGIPFFGICFGNQLLGRALGFETYKLNFGHRGINQPVLNRESKRVEVTAHNHGFAVRMPISGTVTSPAGFGNVRASHICLNDEVIEGIECLDIPAFSVQYHPEAAAGPHDSHYLFDRFIDLIRSHRSEN